MRTENEKRQDGKWAYELIDLLNEKHRLEVSLEIAMRSISEEMNGHARELRKPKVKTVWKQLAKMVDYIVKRYSFDGKLAFSLFSLKKNLETIIFIVREFKTLLHILKND